MFLIWTFSAALIAVAGYRYRHRLRALRNSEAPRVDDDAIRQILEKGTLQTRSKGRVDMKAASEAEEEFWAESWDEPEEYRS